MIISTHAKEEGLNALPLRSEARQRHLLSELPLDTAVEILVSAIREDKEIKCMQVGRQQVKLYS